MIEGLVHSSDNKWDNLLIIAPEDPLGPPFHECEVFLPRVFFKAFAVPSLNMWKVDITSTFLF